MATLRNALRDCPVERLPGRQCRAAAVRRSIWKCGSVPVPTSAVRKLRCWTRSKASAGSFAPSRRSPRCRACSASRPLVHNVLTLASVPLILAKGAQFYRDYGMGRSWAPCPSSWRAIFVTAAWWNGRWPDPARVGGRLRRRHRQWPAAEGCAGGRPARRLGAAVAIRHAAGLRGLRRHGRDARSRWRGGGG